MSDRSKDILSFFQKRPSNTLEGVSDFVSGEDIAKELGFSRTAVWNHIDTLRKLGYEFESVPRLGYRLIKSPDLLFPDEIEASLETKIIGKKIYYYDQTHSTNDIADQLARDGASEGTCVLAEFQTRGRGRLARNWIAPKGKNILLSVIFRPQLDIRHVPLMTLISAIAVSRTLETLGFNPKIKWPNDVYIGNKKVAGILTEMVSEQDAIKHLIIGIGINVNLSLSDLPKDIENKATSLSILTGHHMDRKILLKELLYELEKIYSLITSSQYEKIIEEWSKLSMLSGRWVEIFSGEKKIEGIVLGIDSSGALLLKLENGFVESILSGDIQLKYDE